MQRVAAFLLACLMLVGSLIPQNDLTELSKLPQLLEHYRYHHSVAGGGLSLPEFLAEHYGAGTRHLSGCTLSEWHRQDHQNLPLHSHGPGCTLVVFVLNAARPVVPPAHPTPLVARLYRPAAHSLYQYSPGQGLLQPPRA